MQERHIDYLEKGLFAKMKAAIEKLRGQRDEALRVQEHLVVKRVR
jgi:hypothetical protein